jgi:hypothetical protein
MNNIEAVFRKDCPICHGSGCYYVTESDYEPPIPCDCYMFSDEEWEREKKNSQSDFYYGNENE